MSEVKLDSHEEKCINTIRVLAADTVQKANSGHPGMPMGMAPVAHVLWRKFMNVNPANPKWYNRDRFVLSNGHGCALQYVMLHLTGYQVSMDDLKKFRQLDSITPGHPEVGVTPGIEVTTGPLGQGIANAVGLAIAEAHLAANFNRPNFNIFNNYTYVFCGDGCLQEGVSGEASSLAGHLGLGKLIVIYDDNKITIDGETHLSFSEDVAKRYEAYGWHIAHVENGNNDVVGIENAINSAKAVTDKPTLIILKTIIGFGSAKQGQEAVHGAPLGDEDISNIKKKFGFDPAVKFHVSADVAEEYLKVKQRGEQLEAQWNTLFQAYSQQYPELASEIERRFKGEYPANLLANLPKFSPADKAEGTRMLSEKVLNGFASVLPELIGGSADLTGSNRTAIKGAGDFQKETPQHRYLRFGVREHGMIAIGNGLHAYGGLIPFTATFLNFIEYGYGAARLAALSHHKQLMIMTHDSIGLGEDGPTHQPVEAVALCRATPDMLVFRPADGNETIAAYKAALEHHGPSVLIFSRNAVPNLEHSSVDGYLKGAYIVHESDSKEKPELILLSTGTEVSICIDVAKKMANKKVRVVSVGDWDTFDKQPVEYRRNVIVPGVPTVSVEALAVTGWDRYAHLPIGMTCFGTSAPWKDAYKKFGFTVENISENIEKFLQARHKEAAELGVSTVFAPLRTHFTF